MSNRAIRYSDRSAVPSAVTDFIITAAGSVINGGALTVPPSPGNKIIHPYGDFLLHDIGTGDGISFLPTPGFAFTTNHDSHRAAVGIANPQRLMHDGLSFSLREAVMTFL